MMIDIVIINAASGYATLNMKEVKVNIYASRTVYTSKYLW